MKIKTSPVRGCIDYLPFDMEERQSVVNVILNTYKNHGFLQIKTPILENLDLLCKGDGGDNTKLMFKTIKRGEKLDLTKPNLTEDDIVEEGLRYDLTVPLARFFSNNKANLTYPFKSIQIDESFRAERPQRGRYRQFTQCDIDILGEESVLGEIEIINTAMQTYKNIGLKNLIVKVNSRKILNDIILKSGFKQKDELEICIIIDKIDKIGVEGCKKELLDKEYNKNAVENLCKVLVESRGKGVQVLIEKEFAVEECNNMQKLIDNVKQSLAADFDVVFDLGIVRGQGYYTGTVFEVFQQNGDYKGALGGGGRYDTMIEKIINEPVPAVGLGLGLDVALLVMKEQGVQFAKDKKRLAVIYDKTDEIESILEIKNKLVKTYNVALVPATKNFKELERKLKLNGFDCFIKTRSDSVINQL
jgi:histidyl-tRNA synthetase